MANEHGKVYECGITVAFYENPDATVTGFFKVQSRQPTVERVVPFKYDKWAPHGITLPPEFVARAAQYRKIVEGLTELVDVIWSDATEAFCEMVNEHLNPQPAGPASPGTPPTASTPPELGN
jgi:hypothetical protein